jgi:hypothetical protein
MDRKRIIVIITSVVVVLLIILLIIFLLFRFGQDETSPPELTNTNTEPDEITRQIEQLPPPSEKRVESDEKYPLGLKQFALAYSERFASYSTDANFKNLEDLKPLSTNKMINWIDDYITDFDFNNGEFEAVEARALNNQLLYHAEDTAIITVSLQLTKFKGNRTNPETTYGKVELRGVKVGDQWKIDEVNWQ